MLNRKITTAVSAIVAMAGFSGTAAAQSQESIYGQLPCGFIEVPRTKEPGPSWQIDYKKWESTECAEKRKIVQVKLDRQREARRQQVNEQYEAAEQTRGQMETAHLAAEAMHAEVRNGLAEADRLYQAESGRSSGMRNWIAYKTQLSVVEGLRNRYEESKAAYILARREYEAQLASLNALQAREAAG